MKKKQEKRPKKISEVHQGKPTFDFKDLDKIETISIKDEAQGIGVRSPSTEPVPGSYRAVVLQELQQQSDQKDDDAPTGYYQIPLGQFRIEDIELYDRIFLIRVTQYLFDNLPKNIQKKHSRRS